MLNPFDSALFTTLNNLILQYIGEFNRYHARTHTQCLRMSYLNACKGIHTDRTSGSIHAIRI